MAWQNAVVVKNTTEDDIFSVLIEFVDALEFSATPFRYQDARVVNDAGGRAAFKTAAEAAREVERAKRLNVTSKESAVLNFMNS